MMFILYQLEDADALDQLIDPLLNLEEQLFHHIESIGKKLPSVYFIQSKQVWTSLHKLYKTHFLYLNKITIVFYLNRK